MSQDFQQIGQVSPALDAVATQRQGWQGSPPEPPATEMTDAADYSFRDRRANLQALGRTISNMAAYSEPSMAATTVTPPAAENMPLPPSEFWPR